MYVYHIQYIHRMTGYIHLVLLLILFGATNTLALKMQNIQIINNGKHFYHPFIQTFLMFIGEILVGAVYGCQRGNNQRRINAEASLGYEKKKAKIWYVFVPALMDMVATILAYIALNMVDSSVWQISRGGNIVTTAILSRMLLGRKFSSTAILGCILAFLGITAVQLVTVFLIPSSSNTHPVQQTLIGIGLLLVSLVFNSLGLIAQKHIFNKFEMSALKMVWLEGVYGGVMMIGVITATCLLQCPWSDKSSCINIGNEQYEDYRMEDVGGYMREITSNWLLLVFNIAFIISIAISVPIAVTVSKVISPVSRALADVCRVSLIWIFGIVITVLVGNQHQQYKLQSLDPLANALKSVGFIVLIIGTLLYHDMIRLPCMGAVLKQSILLSEEEDNGQRQPARRTSQALA